MKILHLAKIHLPSATVSSLIASQDWDWGHFWWSWWHQFGPEGLGTLISFDSSEMLCGDFQTFCFKGPVYWLWRLGYWNTGSEKSRSIWLFQYCIKLGNRPPTRSINTLGKLILHGVRHRRFIPGNTLWDISWRCSNSDWRKIWLWAPEGSSLSIAFRLLANHSLDKAFVQGVAHVTPTFHSSVFGVSILVPTALQKPLWVHLKY